MAASADEIRWDRFPRVKSLAEGKKWLEIQHNLGLAANTIEAYARGLEDFLRWCEGAKVKAVKAGRAELASFVGDLRTRPGPRGKCVVAIDSGAGLSNATMQQRLTAIRLFFDYLIEEGARDTNPSDRAAIRSEPRKWFDGAWRKSLGGRASAWIGCFLWLSSRFSGHADCADRRVGPATLAS